MKPAVRALALAVICAAAGQPAGAEGLAEFLGGQGCTLGPASRARALEAGFDAAEIDATIAEALSGTQAVRQGDYIVLGESICTIRLPDLTSEVTLEAPGIQALMIRQDDQEHADQNGCFLNNPAGHFERRFPGPEGMNLYLRFIAQGLVSGALRFHTPSQLRTPYGFQVMTGDCADGTVATASPIDDRAFNAYMRTRMEVTPCDGAQGPLARQVSVAMQDADPLASDHAAGINAWRWFEYDLIAIGAGWVEGASWTFKGTPRPPMCHYSTR